MRLLMIIFLTLSWNIYLSQCYLLHSDNPVSSRIKRTPSKSDEINQKWNSTWTDKLKKDLLLNYDKFSRPAELGTKIIVYSDFIIRHIEMDEQKSTMTLYSWLRMSWNDEKLKWNSSDYGGLKELHLADHEIWQPDIYPYNGVIGSVSDHFGNTNFIAQENGTIIWVPPSIFQVFCDIDLTYWPFDTQVCSLVLGSWTYNGEQVDLQFLHSNDDSFSNKENDLRIKWIFSFQENILIQNSEWKFIKIDKERHSKFYPCCPTPYTDITYNVTVQRQSPTYVALLITPATVIIVMALCVFLIPPVSTDKITLGGTTVIVICLFLLYFTQKLPVMAGHTPLIVIFYSRTLYLLSTVLVISVIVINIAKNPKFSPLPWSIKRQITGCLGKCLLINNLAYKGTSKSLPNSSFKTDETGDSLPVLSETEKQHAECNDYEGFQQDWILFAVMIDRIAFIIFSLLFIGLALTYSI